MKKQEAIEKINKLQKFTLEEGRFEIDIVKKSPVIEIINQIDEPEKPAIPQFVADYIENCKEEPDCALFEAMDDALGYTDLWEWFKYNQETFALAWIYGYNIDQEKLYTVEIPNVYHNSLGYYHLYNNLSFYNKGDTKEVRFELTEAEIKSVDERLWQFAKEVEND
ncbi:phage protein [Streptococcus equi subsp. equi]|uniref:DUF1642 domain-containing protein n=1 Tax=Streptococcus equi TaxID=1336 RepID=UPI0006588B01|nr:phage protein [Streptococcus equi subsp. equi]